MVICLVQGADDLHGPADATTFQIIFVSLKFEIQNGLPYLMLEYPNSAEKGQQMSMHVCARYS